MRLTGYSRKNSKVGIRDYNVIFSTVALTNRWGEIVSNKVPEAILCCGELTRGLRGIDLVRQNEFTKSLILHPNIGSILILTIDIISENSLKNFVEDIKDLARSYGCTTFCVIPSNRWNMMTSDYYNDNVEKVEDKVISLSFTNHKKEKFIIEKIDDKM